MPRERADTRFALARALSAKDPGDLRARTLAGEALNLVEGSTPRLSPNADEIHQWLKTRP